MPSKSKVYLFLIVKGEKIRSLCYTKAHKSYISLSTSKGFLEHSPDLHIITLTAVAKDAGGPLKPETCPLRPPFRQCLPGCARLLVENSGPQTHRE